MHTTRARDHGLDAVVFVGGEKLGVQIKRHKAVIGSDKIRTFIGSLRNAKLRQGIFICTSRYSKDAVETARRNRIRLLAADDVPTLERLVSELCRG